MNRAKRGLIHGWAWPAHTIRAHYFVDGESLCEEVHLPIGMTPRPSDIVVAQDCALCARMLPTWRGESIRLGLLAVAPEAVKHDGRGHHAVDRVGDQNPG